MILRQQLKTVVIFSAVKLGYAFHALPRATIQTWDCVNNIRYTESARHLFPKVTQNAASGDETKAIDASDTSQNSDSTINLFAFMKSVLPQMDDKFASPITTEPIETEEQKLQRLKEERLAEIEAGEVRRQQRVSEDKLGYLFLFSLQFLPLIGNDRVISILYFFGLAVTTVYLGGRQEVIAAPEKISRKSAFFAPVFASVSIALFYYLLKVGIDPTSLYAIAVTIFGALSISDIGVPILRNIFPGYDFANAELQVPEGLAKALDLDKPALPLDGLVTLAFGVICTLAYWTPVAMEQKFLVSNVIAWALGMVSLGAISLGSYQTGALFLAGLFFYDIFWVFKTDVMMTVATQVEAPVKFLFTAPPSDVPRPYNFSVLGLGDVVIPGLFVRLMAKLDEFLQPKNLSYFKVATAAYAGGLALCFGANELFHNGQPALLYLDPSLVGGTLACAAVNGQVADVWNFTEADDEEMK